MRRGQRVFRPDNKEDRHACLAGSDAEFCFVRAAKIKRLNSRRNVNVAATHIGKSRANTADKRSFINRRTERLNYSLFRRGPPINGAG